MKERKLDTRVYDAYVADLNRSAHNFRQWFRIVCVFLISLATAVLFVRNFNPIMDAVDRATTDVAAVTHQTANWQLIIDATAGSMFQLRDKSFCVLDASYLQTRMLKMRCKDSGENETTFTEQRVDEITEYYPVGSEEWRKHKYLFFDEVLS